VNEISISALKELLEYDQLTGIFKWRNSRSGVSKGVAGTVQGSGYIQIRVLGKRFYAHRLAYAYVTGTWPKNLIDHKNTNRIDNSFDNLREAANSLNAHNSKLTCGVARNKNGSYRACLVSDGVHIRFGAFDSLEYAMRVYQHLRHYFTNFKVDVADYDNSIMRIVIVNVATRLSPQPTVVAIAPQL
jgi:hypothetical protein